MEYIIIFLTALVGAVLTYINWRILYISRDIYTVSKELLDINVQIYTVTRQLLRQTAKLQEKI